MYLAAYTAKLGCADMDKRLCYAMVSMLVNLLLSTALCFALS